MRPSEIFEVLDLAMRARKNGDIFNPCFIGSPGLGKTEVIIQWAKERGMSTVPMTLSSYDAPDIKGYPHVQIIKGKQRLSFATPDNLPDEGFGVIILDELNRANTSVMNCILSLTDARRGFDGYTLPPGWIVCASINPEDSIYDTTTLDPALRDRFEMFNVSYDRPSFLTYAANSGWNKDLVNFVESGIFQYKEPQDIGNVAGAKYVSPRTLSKLNTILKAGFPPEMEMLLYTTELGSNVAKDFYNFRHNESPVSMADLDKNLEASLAKLKKFSDPSNYKNGMISLTVKDVLEVNTISDEVLTKLALVLPVENGTVLIRELEFKRKDDTILSRLCKSSSELKAVFKAVLKYGADAKKNEKT